MKAKISIVVLSALLMFSTAINAQPTKEQKMENLTQNCYKALTSDNEGVKEAGIYLSIQFKNKFPNEIDGKFVKALDNLASDSQNPRISYKAQLAKIYIQHPDWFKNIEIKSIFNDEETYLNIAKRINNEMFAATF